MYGKHFQSTYTGSMVGAGPVVFAVWGYVIAHTRDSLVELNPVLLAAILGCPAGDIESAINFLCLPDSRSRSKISNGQRLIKEGEFIYRVPTHSKYRSIRNDEDRRAYMRVYMQEYRNKNKGLDDVKASVNSDKPRLAHSEAESESESESETSKKKKRGRSSAILLATYLEECREEDKKAIPETDPVFTYAEQIGIPGDFLELAWKFFRDDMLAKGKRQKDWPATFRTYVKKDYMRLWAINSAGEYYLTTTGKQAARKYGNV